MVGRGGGGGGEGGGVEDPVEGLLDGDVSRICEGSWVC